MQVSCGVTHILYQGKQGLPEIIETSYIGENRPNAFPAPPPSDSSGLARQFRSARLHTIYFCTDLILSCPWELSLSAFDRTPTVPSFGKLPFQLLGPVPVSGFYIKEFS